LLLTAVLLCDVLLRRRCCWAPAVQESIDISCPPGPQQQTRRTLLQRSIGGTDKRTDRRTPYRYIDLVAYANSVSNTRKAYTVLFDSENDRKPTHESTKAVSVVAVLVMYGAYGVVNRK